MYEYAIKIFLLLDDFKKRDKSKELLLQVCLGFLVTQVKKNTSPGHTEKKSYFDLIELYSQKLGFKPENLSDYTKNRHLRILEILKKNAQN